MHPKDWAHPGRIKVELFDAEGNPKNPTVQNSTLYIPNLIIFIFRESII